MILASDQKKSNAVQLLEVNCPLCESNDYDIVFTPWNNEVDFRQVLSASGGVRGTQQIVSCKQCKMLYVNPRPDPESIVDGYTNATDEVYVGASEARKVTFRRNVRLIEKYVDTGKLLDVGAAAGFFVKSAVEAGWDAVGVEPCRWLAQYGAERLGVKILPQTLSTANFPDDSFDVVTMWDVLEHVPDPLAELTEIRRILRPNGWLLVNFPDIGTWQAKLAGSKWWFLLSVHLTYFTKGTMQAMLKKAGFVDLKFRPHFQTLNLAHLSKMGSLYAPGISRALAKYLDKSAIGRMPIPYYASQTNVIARASDH